MGYLFSENELVSLEFYMSFKRKENNLWKKDVLPG